MNYIFLHEADLIVKCEPELSDNVWLDDSNNMFVKIQIKVSDLWEKDYEWV